MFGILCTTAAALAWNPEVVAEDPLVRMPGTQPNEAILESPDRCLTCHADYDPAVEPGGLWKGSMMSQSMRDPLFWAAVTVAAQDSIWALGNPNATDLCLRCHSPSGWLAGNSDPTNGSLMTGSDFDGVSCDACHRMVDPHFGATYAGTREGNDWLGYWDETNATSPSSADSATDTYFDDGAATSSLRLFNGTPMYSGDMPAQTGWFEAAGGQLVMDAATNKRASFADHAARHTASYSRFHKSRYLCASCHDVSNPVLSSLAYADTVPGDGVTVLPAESTPAHGLVAVERTFSEFMLSDFGLQGGAPGTGDFDPAVFDTSRPGNWIATCQDCHMADAPGKGCDKADALFRPDDSLEHPNSGQPTHDLTGGNLWVPALLASTVLGSPNYDATNAVLLGQGRATLTLDLTAGLGIDPQALLKGTVRARAMLESAATLDDLVYDRATGDLALKVTNHTGHKLISGFPDGRRMFLNVQLLRDGVLLEEINPYDYTVGTLKGLGVPGSPPLGPGERYEDALVYEARPSSSLTGEEHTFHFVLADGMEKDNRIPPRGFRVAEAGARRALPASNGQDDPGWFSAAEYGGGYDDVLLSVARGADEVRVSLLYQTTSREYVAFLRDEVNGLGGLPSPTPSGEPQAYIAQTDPWFGALAAWGDTLWALWDHNKDLPGARPVMMTQTTWSCGGCGLTLYPADPGRAGEQNTWTVDGGQPGTKVHVVYGLAGLTPVPGCPGVSVDLDAPAVLGKVTLDANGSGSLSIAVPAQAGGVSRWFQAAWVGGCEVSNSYEQTFQ